MEFDLSIVFGGMIIGMFIMFGIILSYNMWVNKVKWITRYIKYYDKYACDRCGRMYIYKSQADNCCKTIGEMNANN